jgi:hypothetical protein
VCSGSGNCIPACPEGIDTRFMVQLARGFARAQAGDKPLNTRWRQGFQTMSRGVRILSRLQLPPETLARVRGQSAEEARQSPPDVVFYTGCNILKTPHIALLCLDVLDLLGVDYEVMGWRRVRDQHELERRADGGRRPRLLYRRKGRGCRRFVQRTENPAGSPGAAERPCLAVQAYCKNLPSDHGQRAGISKLNPRRRGDSFF